LISSASVAEAIWRRQLLRAGSFHGNLVSATNPVCFIDPTVNAISCGYCLRCDTHNMLPTKDGQFLVVLSQPLGTNRKRSDKEKRKRKPMNMINSRKKLINSPLTAVRLIKRSSISWSEWFMEMSISVRSERVKRWRTVCDWWRWGYWTD